MPLSNVDFRKKIGEAVSNSKPIRERAIEASENIKEDLGISPMRRKAAEEEAKRKMKPGY